MENVEIIDKKSLANNIVSLAHQYGNGASFGGFVRDYIVRQRDFSDLDIWFKREEDANEFLLQLSSMNCKFVKSLQVDQVDNKNEDELLLPLPLIFNGIHQFETDNDYPFQRMKIYLVFKNIGENKEDQEINVPIDVVVSSYFPVNDFDVNLGVWNSKTLVLGKTTGSINTVDQLISKIKSNQASMLPEYKLLHENTSACRERTLLLMNRNIFTIDNL